MSADWMTREVWTLHETGERLTLGRCFSCGALLWVRRDGTVLGGHAYPCEPRAAGALPDGSSC